jgi:hypothetical protein
MLASPILSIIRFRICGLSVNDGIKETLLHGYAIGMLPSDVTGMFEPCLYEALEVARVMKESEGLRSSIKGTRWSAPR